MFSEKSNIPVHMQIITLTRDSSGVTPWNTTLCVGYYALLNTTKHALPYGKFYMCLLGEVIIFLVCSRN